jgi:hypothetical protein
MSAKVGGKAQHVGALETELSAIAAILQGGDAP